MKISDKIRHRIQNYNSLVVPLKEPSEIKSTDNISDFLEHGEVELLIEEVSDKMKEVFESLIIDTENDHNMKDTANRVAKMFVKEIFAGRYMPRPDITAFPNAKKYDELYVTGPITVRSTCAHHFMPIKGVAYIGVFPGTDVIGLSKFNRIVDWVVSRPQIQEEMTIQIANEVKEVTKTESVAVLIQAEHFCMTHRGVREHDSAMTTSAIFGEIREKPHLKQEFMSIIKMIQDR